MRKDSSNQRCHERIAYILQGGGALGTYQVGVITSFYEQGYYPDVISGISIGAINAAIIAGNARKDVIEKLNGFWERIATNALYNFFESFEFLNTLYEELGAISAVIFGQPNFYMPRLENPLLVSTTSVDKISFYDFSQLRSTLEEFVDFDRINAKEILLYLGAVSVSNGEAVYFTNEHQVIRPEHIMASAALPPGFPAVKIDDTYYWDGGIYSNTPLAAFLGTKPKYNVLCFSINCFNSTGPLPKNLDDVQQRIKDIRYASHMKEYFELYQEQQNLRGAIAHLAKQLPAGAIQDPTIKKIIADGCSKLVNIVKIDYPFSKTDTSGKDFNFSRIALDTHRKTGYRDGMATLKQKAWECETACHIGAIVHEAP